MQFEHFRAYCLSLPNATEALPFDQQTLVFKVRGKMFALTNMNTFTSINVKCDPAIAIQLRESYPCVQPGYHMNKKHWNTLLINAEMPDEEIYQWIRHSYDLVREKTAPLYRQ